MNKQFGALGIFFCVFSLAAHAAPLVTEAEAKLPAAQEPPKLLTRGISRGPTVKQVSPEPSAALKSPINLKVAFEAHGGAAIDPASVTATYVKATPVDLLPRIKAGLSPTGIDMANAELPAGEHQIRLTVKDSEGRQTTTTLQLNVVK